MRLKNNMLLGAVLALTLSGCGADSAAEEETVRVATASSLSGVMEELISGFEEDNPGVVVVANYGSSSKLRNQIENGAPADLFLSASERDMEILEEKGSVDERSISPFAGNGLVMATSEEIVAGSDLQTILTSVDGTLAIADPASVPLGGYTKQALEAMGIWELAEEKMIYAKDARQVVTYLESGNAQAGIMYASDVELSQNVAEMSLLPVESAEIIYPAAILTDSVQQQHAESFMTYILSEEGQEIIGKFGFKPIEGRQP